MKFERIWMALVSSVPPHFVGAIHQNNILLLYNNYGFFLSDSDTKNYSNIHSFDATNTLNDNYR